MAYNRPDYLLLGFTLPALAFAEGVASEDRLYGSHSRWH